jgi:3-deoxy-D-manno-octulosonate 8-phosphate phosphatase (KDO 8-P phosphatase)
VVFDVDGVLTDAGVYLGRTADGSPLELKRFDIQDGLGVKLLMRAGLVVAFLSGRVSEATLLRAAELGVTECLQDDAARKVPLLRGVLERHGVGWEEVAMVGDDLPDLPVLERVGLPVAVANAQPEVMERALWRTTAPGGRGAVREFSRALLLAGGDWDRVVGEYLGERSGD